ncbi:DNA repair protein RadC [Bacteroidota bacterium]
MINYKKLKIKKWALEDRPREKMLEKGISSLSDSELLAILVGSGIKDQSAVDLAKKILHIAQNNLNELGKLNIKSLQKIKGVGEVRAITIIAALELGRRRKISDILNRKRITTSNDVFELFHSILSDLPYEEFWILLLNRSNKIIEKVKISQGGITGTIIDVRLILKNAIERLATSIILCHNHPSGNLQPSDSDKLITRKIQEAGKYLDLPVIDHVIVCDGAYYSFADEGKL